MLQPLIMCVALGLLSLTASLVKAQETGCSWDLVAHPPLIVPGQESVVFVAPKGCNFSQSSDDLMATLSIWDTSHHKVIHGMVWQVQPQPSFDTTFYGGYPKDVEIPPKVIMVPFRVPSSLPPSQGVLRLHSQRDCHPYVETRQIQDEKCPQNCTSKCLEIPFRLASSIRQILLIADKTDYQPGETVRLRYQVLDESTLPKKPAELTITIADASGARIHTWNLGYLQRKTNENKDLFEEITFPLSPRCTKGKWIICAQDWPSIIDANGKKKYCINFHVKDQNLEDLETSILSPESQTFESFVNLEMVAPPTFRTGVPYSGKVLTASRLLSSEEEAVEAVEAMEAEDDEELEVLVKLLEGGDNSSSSTSNLLDQQTLLINEEAVFNFAPIKSTSDHLTVEVYLQVPLSKTNIEDEDVDTELEIDEVNAFDEEQVSEKSTTKLLLSKVIHRESESSERYDCPIWTQGLERTFKTGDFAAVTVKVSPACGCQQDLGLYWVLMRDDQFVAWGQQPQPTDENGECVYRFGLEMTSRMAPTATFKAFRPNLEGDFYATDEQNVTVNLEDRTLVILELNRTEVSHSSALVGMEVFAEPESTICLRGRKMENSLKFESGSKKKKESISDTFVTTAEDSKGMIKVLEPVSKTWFFQCGSASEDGFYATWIRAPLEGGQWSVEAVSLSPFHGLRMAQPQPLLRTKPIHVQIDGIPALVRRGEILTNLTLRTRNNMPIPLKLTVIVSGSQGIFFTSESHFQTLQQNASGYESIEHQLKMHVNTLETDSERRKNISVLVTATALMEGRFVEVDSVHVIKELLILPRGQRVVEHQLDYFCTSAGHGSTSASSAKAKTLDVLKIEEGQGGVNFSIKGTDEVVLLIEDPQSGLKFKMALGAQENSVTYLSLLSKEGEIRLDSQNTADILSMDSKHFWLYWKLDNAHVEQLQLGLADEQEALVKWPVPVTFSPSQITVLRVPESDVEIRFWHGQQLLEVGSNKESTTHEMEDEATLRGGGHNRIFHTTLANTSLILNDTITAQIILSDGFNLPLTESGLLTPLGSFHQMLDVLRDAATLSILERLQNVPKGHYTSSEEKERKMHLLAQDLIYFRNVDGSFGEPLTRQTFSLALEQLWLMSEIENFYPLSAFMKSGLEKWLIKNSKENLNPEDVLLWAPRDSKVFHSLGIQAHRDCTENILNLRDEIGPMGLLRTQPFFSRTLAALSSVSSSNSNDTKLVEELLELYLRNAEWKKCQKSHFEELPYILWTMANLGQLNEPAIFECVHTHSQEMLSSPEVGYSVIRALVSSYQTSKKKLSKPSWKQDLKISLATSEDLGHSRTWRMTRGGEENKKEGNQDLFEPIVNHSIQHVWLEHPVPDKLFFLATGEGCGTVEVLTTYETMANDNSNSIYDVSLETSKDENDIVFLTLCLKMKAEKASVATSVSVEFFTGYHFISSTSKDFWYHSWHRDHNVILHVSKVPSECGSCVTLKFTRVYEIDELAPAKLTVYPTMASSRAKEAYQQFFYINGTLHQDMSSTTNDNFTLPTSICPCSYKCPKALSEDSEDAEEAKVNMTVTKTTSTETTSQSTSINKEIEAIEAVEAVTAKMVANTSNDINGDINLGAETISLASSTTTTAAASTASEAVEDEDITSDLSLNDAV